jgi:hypothetical protein
LAERLHGEHHALAERRGETQPCADHHHRQRPFSARLVAAAPQQDERADRRGQRRQHGQQHDAVFIAEPEAFIDARMFRRAARYSP